MGKINVLSFEVANLIAAGEVVDRPASVVKELIENSIDAGAKNITVEIKNGGVVFIRVSDDGCGIAPEDMPLALKRHATSKISLAAIASVSKLRIISKTAEAASGTMLYAEEGRILSVEEAGCPCGTTITAEQLFANVPARRKFLKKDSTETAAVAAAVEKIALSHPEIAFRLITDGNIKLESPGDGRLENTIYAVLGKDFAKRILPVKCRNAGIEVTGFIGCPDNVKPTRNFQNFFINRRYVKSKTVMAALEQAYTSYIAPERFPSCVLFIDLNPASVDVNVHPAKLEVKFSNEKLIFESVYYAVRSTLEKNTERPELLLRSPASSNMSAVANAFLPVLEPSERKAAAAEQLRIEQTNTMSFASGISDAWRARVREELKQERIRSEAIKFSPQDEVSIPASDPVPPSKETPDAESSAVEQGEEAEKEPLPLPEYRILGVAFNTYIFTEIKDCLVVIDKHAAHERIIFESLRGKLRNFKPAPQILLVPVVIDLTKNDFDAVVEHSEKLKELGFDFDMDPAQSRVQLTQIPSALQLAEAEAVFASMADQMASGTGILPIAKQDAYERALYQASCKAAMKGGRVDADKDIQYVVEKILTVPDITVCPHGRPVVFYLTKHALDRQFGRE